MPFTLRSEPHEIVAPISIGDDFQFEIIIRPPNVEAELSALFSSNPLGERIHASVIGWRGVVNESGEPVPFTPAALSSMLRQVPSVGLKILDALQPLYQGVSEDQRKNSEAPRKTGSEPSSAETTP